MFNRFYPDEDVASAYDIPYDALYKKGIRGVIFDVDNTLVPHDAPADERAKRLFSHLRALGMDTCLLSNNKEPRVAAFAEAVGGSNYIYKGGKPGVKNYKKAMELMGTSLNSTIFVGDQLFTDVYGAKRTGIRSFLVKPINPKEEIQIVLKRTKRGDSMISGKSKVCGVMAYPVEHSMSPLMHNYYSEKTGTDLVYVPLKVEPGRVEEAVKGAYALNFTGMNVTVPHKQEVMKYLVDIDEDAKAIGAVNTLVRTDGGYKGYNTDAAGLKRAMTEAGIEIRDRTCILFGAGGAARAAACVLAKEGASVIYVLNRSLEKAEALSEIVNERFGRRVMLPMALDDYGRLECSSCLAVQTTSVGMHPNVDHAPVEDAEFYKKIDTAVDIVYTPMETKFMKYVRAAGGKAVGGLDMLIYQGVIAYELWNPETVFTREMIDGARVLMREELEAAR